MTPAIAANALQFLGSERLTLKGNEVNAYIEVMQALAVIANTPAEVPVEEKGEEARECLVVEEVKKSA